MGFQLRLLWSAPEINPYNGKARSIPVLNPYNKHGRVFFFSYLGFFIAFWSWYAFPPLLSISIKRDLHLSDAEVANSNIIALTSTLIVRVVAGPMCDQIGPRLTFVTLLLLGAIPTALAGTATDVTGLYLIRFFVGILGGTFVPCQVWTTGFFDENVVGTANALVGGWGNAGGGITYFAMPAIYDSLVHDRGLTSHVAWRVSFLVPFSLITTTALGMLLFADDSPAGKWSQRGTIFIHEPRKLPAALPTRDTPTPASIPDLVLPSTTNTPKPTLPVPRTASVKHDISPLPVLPPTLRLTIDTLSSPQTLVLSLTYFCAFGSELALASVLGTYYLSTHPSTLTQTTSGRWAAMYGLLNLVTRPLGGIISDALYTALTTSSPPSSTRALWAKKTWMHSTCLLAGTILILLGTLAPRTLGTQICLLALVAAAGQAANGAVFALVPHVCARQNGVVAGAVGAAGNLGGVVFACVFRFVGGAEGGLEALEKGFWVVGGVLVVVNLGCMVVGPVGREGGSLGGVGRF